MQTKKNYLWLDLESTGLDKDRCSLIEVAAIVTDRQLEELAFFHRIIYTPNAYWEEKALEMHIQSGLVAKLGDLTKASRESVVKSELYELIRNHFPEPAMLAGSSIHTDKAWLEEKWPDVSYFSHRVLNTSSIARFLKDCFGEDLFKEWEERNGVTKIAHSAVDDVKYCLNLARHIKSKLNWKIE